MSESRPRYITIYGERCSGTNYLEKLIRINFCNPITWKFGWKHFFGFEQDRLRNSDDTLFICIVRDIEEWLNSFYRAKWHIAPHLRDSLNNFLNAEFFSYNDKASGLRDGSEILTDRNIYTGKRYKNIFELRHTKLKYMIDDLSKKVKNYIFIKYEDLINNFENTMTKIATRGMQVWPGINFPLNHYGYKNGQSEFKKHKLYIPRELIFKNPNLLPHYEKQLGYI